MNPETLAYTSLTDFDDLMTLQSSNIRYLATQGLVLQYQSLTNKYTQPIAGFALKRSACEEYLAKIVFKATYLLKNVGAFIHDVIGGSALTNRGMTRYNSSINEFKKKTDSLIRR